MRQRDTILLTGFGPFPGVPQNVSERFVSKLAHLAARRFSAHRVVARILPTEWERAPQRLEALYERERPKLVLHFGVSPDANSYVLEGIAHNTCKPAEDAAGELPSASVVVEGGSDTLDAKLPADDIVERLRAIRVPIVTSDDAGGYLCNALLYRSLFLASQLREPPVVGFFHIPRVIPAAPARPGAANDLRFDWGTALTGGLEIIRTCLGRPPPRRHPRAKAR